MRINRVVATRLIQAAVKAAWNCPDGPEIKVVRERLLALLDIVDAPAVPSRTVEDDLEDLFRNMNMAVGHAAAKGEAMKFEELTVGRTIHFIYMDKCRAAIVIARDSASVVLRVFVNAGGATGDFNTDVDDMSKDWHDPRGCVR